MASKCEIIKFDGGSRATLNDGTLMTMVTCQCGIIEAATVSTPVYQPEAVLIILTVMYHQGHWMLENPLSSIVRNFSHTLAISLFVCMHE